MKNYQNIQTPQPLTLVIFKIYKNWLKLPKSLKHSKKLIFENIDASIKFLSYLKISQKTTKTIPKQCYNI
jgi:hypothetical protein